MSWMLAGTQGFGAEIEKLDFNLPSRSSMRPTARHWLLSVIDRENHPAAAFCKTGSAKVESTNPADGLQENCLPLFLDAFKRI